MNRMMKNGIALAFLLVLLCLNACAIGENDVKSLEAGPVSLSGEEMKAFLISRDYPSDYLDTLILPQLENLYHVASEHNAYFYARTSGNAEEMDFWITMSYTPVVNGGTAYYGEIFITVDYEWTQLPMVRGIDAITVNWDSDILKYGGDDSFVSYDYMKNPLNNKWEVYKTWTQPKAANQGGLGIDTYIDSGTYFDYSWVNASGLKGSVNFSLQPETILSMTIEPSGGTTVSAQYTHDKNPLGLGPGVVFRAAPGLLQDTILATHEIRYTYVE